MTISLVLIFDDKCKVGIVKQLTFVIFSLMFSSIVLAQYKQYICEAKELLV